jgi:hypothetical protein
MGINLGLVGLGSFGRTFADLFMSHPGVDRIALNPGGSRMHTDRFDNPQAISVYPSSILLLPYPHPAIIRPVA